MCKHPLVKTLLAALALLLVTLPASAAFQPATCGDVEAWVSTNQDALPQTLADFETVPAGFEPGVFAALAPEVRGEMWNEFLDAYVAQNDLDQDAIAGVRAFDSYMEAPQTFAEIDDASRETLSDLLGAFTLHLVDPVTELAVGGLMQVTVDTCNCNRNLDWMCMAMFCLPTQFGCGPSGSDPCTGIYGD